MSRRGNVFTTHIVWTPLKEKFKDLGIKMSAGKENRNKLTSSKSWRRD